MAIPWASSCSASADWVNRSAHRSPHQARSSGVAKHQVDAEGTTEVNPDSRAQWSSLRPASQLAPLSRVSAAVGLEGPANWGSSGK